MARAIVRVQVPAKLVRYAERELGRLFRETAPGRVDLSTVVGACALEGIVALIHDIGRPRVRRARSLIETYMAWYLDTPQGISRQKPARKRTLRAVPISTAPSHA